MRIAGCVLELHMPGITGLKQKRQVLKSLIQRLRNHFNISIVEIGSQDLWQRAELGLAVVSINGGSARRTVEQIRSFIEDEFNLEVIGFTVDIH